MGSQRLISDMKTYSYTSFHHSHTTNKQVTKCRDPSSPGNAPGQYHQDAPPWHSSERAAPSPALWHKLFLGPPKTAQQLPQGPGTPLPGPAAPRPAACSRYSRPGRGEGTRCWPRQGSSSRHTPGEGEPRPLTLPSLDSGDPKLLKL